MKLLYNRIVILILFTHELQHNTQIEKIQQWKREKGRNTNFFKVYSNLSSKKFIPVNSCLPNIQASTFSKKVPK